MRRGLYAVVAPGNTPETCPVDPYLVAAKSADDAVLAYHTALEVHGKAHSVFEQYFFQSNTPLRPMTFRTLLQKEMASRADNFPLAVPNPKPAAWSPPAPGSGAPDRVKNNAKQ